MASKESHIYRKKEFELKSLFKKTSFLLAIVTFVIALIVALYYDRFLAAPSETNQRNLTTSLTQFSSSEEFISFINIPSIRPTEDISTENQIARDYFNSLNSFETVSFKSKSEHNQRYAFYDKDEELIKMISNISDTPTTDEFLEDGQLLLRNNLLFLKSSNTLKAISTETENQVWEIDFNENTIDTATFKDNIIYVGIKHKLDNNFTCPLPFATQNTIEITTPCDTVYYPQSSQRSFEFVYTFIKIDTTNGGILDRVSFVGSSSSIFTIQNKAYLAYSLDFTSADQLYSFFITEAVDTLPAEIISKLQRLETLDLSNEAKLVELKSTINDYVDSLPEDLRQDFVNDMSEKLGEGLDNVSGIKTLLVQINLEDFSLNSSSLISGNLTSKYNFLETEDKIFLALSNQISGLNPSHHIKILSSELTEEISLTTQNNATKSLTNLNTNFKLAYGPTESFLIRIDNPVAIPLKEASLLVPLDDNYLLSLTGNETITKLSLYKLNENELVTSLNLNEPFSNLVRNLESFRNNPESENFFISGLLRSYVISYAGERFSILRTLTAENALFTVLENNLLTVIAKNVIEVINTNTRTIESSTPLR